MGADHTATRREPLRITRIPLDPVRGAEAAKELKRLRAKPILIKAAERGYITEVKCAMPKCFYPEELGGASHFDPATAEYGPWEPTFEHFPIPKREGGRESVDNAVLAHRLCNRIDFSISDGRSHKGDLETIREARDVAAAAEASSRAN